MGRVTYNQSGYVGQSMSERACEAYKNGEMPKSKWTKKAMVNAIEEFCDYKDLYFDEDVIKGMNKEELFHKFFHFSSWHHTSKYAQETDFYALDEDEVCEVFRTLTEELELKKQRVWEDIYMRQRLGDLEERRKSADKAKRELYEKQHGFKSDTVAALCEEFPELVEYRHSRKNNEIVEYPYFIYDNTVHKQSCLKRDVKYRNASFFNATGNMMNSFTYEVNKDEPFMQFLVAYATELIKADKELLFRN